MMRFAQENPHTELGDKYNYLLQKPSWPSRLAKGMFRAHCRFVMSWYTPLTIEGADNLPKDTSYILCSNHNSHMDSAVLMLATGKNFGLCAMVAAKDYFFDHWWRRICATTFMNLIPLDRKVSPRSGGLDHYFAVCKAFCDRGQRTIVVYPEGTRSKTGNMSPFKKGPAMLACETGVTLVPAYIEGTFACWPKGRLLIRPGKIRVHIGKPIEMSCYEELAPDDRKGKMQRYKDVTCELEQRIHALAEGIKK